MRDYTRELWQSNRQKYDLYVGLDVDKSSISVTVKEVMRPGRSLKMPYDPQILLSFIRNRYPGKRVIFAYEAGPTGFGLYDAIISVGYDCIVVSPGSVPSAPNRRVKTNKLDSKKLAERMHCVLREQRSYTGRLVA